MSGENRGKKGLFRGKRGYGGISTLLAVMLIAGLILLNLSATALEEKTGWWADWSYNSITTHSEETRNLLAGLNRPVHIYAFFRTGEEDGPLFSLLDRYAAASSFVTWEQADPGLNPALLARFSDDSVQVGADMLVVSCPETGRWKVLQAEDFVSLGLDGETGTYTSAGWIYERSITRAIAQAVQDTLPRVVISQGHGEAGKDETEALESLLENNRYETVRANLSDTAFSPEPSDILVFLDPVRDLTDEELKKAVDFAEAGGSFLFSCDYTAPIAQMEHYGALLRSYGFVPEDGIVVAERGDGSHYYNGVQFYLIPDMESTDLTFALLAEGRTAVLMPGARAFRDEEETDRNLMVSAVLRSGKQAYLKQLSGDTVNLEKTEGDDSRGAYPLALQARRITGKGYVSRAFAVGCTALLTENRIWAMTDHQELILRVMAFLQNESADGLMIQARDALRPALGIESIGPGSVLVSALPLSVAAAALLVLVPRKNRKQENTHAEG